MNEEMKPALAEMLGTFILVFLGAGAGAISGQLPVVAMAHGLGLVIAIYAIGAVSGAHVNPAITLGLAVTGKLPWKRAGIYWAAQIVGAIVAAFVLKACVPYWVRGLGETTLQDGVSAGQGVLVEAVLTTLLALSVMVSGVLGKNEGLFGLIIGFTLVACILMGGPLTGASLNPARTLGPAIVGGNMADVWVYLVGPGLGGITGALIGKYFRE